MIEGNVKVCRYDGFSGYLSVYIWKPDIQKTTLRTYFGIYTSAYVFWVKKMPFICTQAKRTIHRKTTSKT